VTDDFINPPRKQIAITAGRLSAVKGYDRLIEIWAHVSPEIRGGWALHIYGDGEEAYKSLLYRRIQAYSLNDSVQLKGNTLQILEKFKEASVYLCTSQTESFGMTLVEAESCGLPVISFDCPHGPKNIINHTCDGFLVEDFSIDKFAHYLELILGNSELRQNMGREALANSKRFSTARVMSQWLENLYSIINNPN
jgi:glycosyltransferase involved in cell wall biosynthesis